ncbi:MAG: hypothetical protein D6681_10635, partial [Calditrichaeota bacterium]
MGDDFTYIAGGTDVMVNRQQENETASCLVDISGIEELQQVTVEGQTLKIGALVKLDQLKHYPEIQENFPVLIEAAEAVGSPLIRKTGTIGGNLLCENRCVYYNHSAFWREAVNYCLKSGGDICIASGGPKACFSEFVSDTAPALICLDAQVEIVDTTGTELKPLESIYTGDGLKPRNLPKTALLAFIHLSLNASYQAVFKKLRPRSGVDFTSLTTAVSLNGENRLKIAVGGVSPGPVVVEAPADTDREQLIRQVLKGCKTVDN